MYQKSKNRKKDYSNHLRKKTIERVKKESTHEEMRYNILKKNLVSMDKNGIEWNIRKESAREMRGVYQFKPQILSF